MYIYYRCTPTSTHTRVTAFKSLSNFVLFRMYCFGIVFLFDYQNFLDRLPPYMGILTICGRRTSAAGRRGQASEPSRLR